MTSLGGVPTDMDPVSGERYDDGFADTDTDTDAERAADRLRHLEEMFVRNNQVMADQAQLIADQKAERDQLRLALSDALQVATDRGNALHARDARIAELEGQLGRERRSVEVLLTQRDTAERQAETYATDAERANARAQVAAEAAESYRVELMEAKRLLRNIAELSDGALDD